MGVLLLMQAMKTKINKKLYGLIAFVFLSICGSVFFLFKNTPQKDAGTVFRLTKEKGYFLPLKIQGYSSADLPYLEVAIGDKTIKVILDLGYSGMLSLPSDVIKDIEEKKWIKRVQSCGLRGKIYEDDVYEVKKVKIETLSFFPAKIEEESLESMQNSLLFREGDVSEGHPSDYFGKIGWGLFCNSNLLIDCKHSTIALCDSLATLKQQGYPVDSFIETPLVSDSNFVKFEALTEKGPLTCVLDTGATWNLLNKDLENGNNSHRIYSNQSKPLSSLNPKNEDLLIYDPDEFQEFSSFKVSGKELGPQTFDLIKSPVPVDAFIGMEFFHSTLVFVDFANSKVYFYPYPEEKEEKKEELAEEEGLSSVEGLPSKEEIE